MLTLKQRSPLKFSSGWGHLEQIDYSHRQQRALFPISFTGKRGVTQYNELLIQIAWSYKYFYIENWKEK